MEQFIEFDHDLFLYPILTDILFLRKINYERLK